MRAVNPLENQRGRSTTIFASAALALALSVAAGTPDHEQLPITAFSWAVLFHVERAGALVVVLSALLIVGWRASRGELPTRFANIEYRVDGTSRSVERLARKVRRLEFLLEARNQEGLEDVDDEA